MFKKSVLVLVVLVFICCGPTVLVPPEIDLQKEDCKQVQ